jgi:PAS domain S-box-containing protein
MATTKNPERESTHVPSQPALDNVELLIAEMGLTLDASALHIESERRRAEAEALAELVRQGATDPDTDRVVGLVTETASHLLGADYAGVALVEADGSRSWRGVWGNRSDAWRTTARLAGRGPVAQCISEGRTIVSEHLQDHPDFPMANLTLHTSEGGRTALTTPLFSRDGTLGALVLGWRSDFSPAADHIRLAEALAGYAATVIDNARAHSRVATRAEELRILYEALACGVLVRDADGRIIHVNAAGEEIFGIGLDEMQGRTSASLWRAIREDGTAVPPEARPGAVALREGQPVRRFTEGVVRRDGTIRWLQVDSVPVFDAGGTLRRVVSSFIDVTARKQAEEEIKQLNQDLERRVLERTSELEAANKELEAFSYSVSHDLRAPLRSIDGFSQALLEDYGSVLEGAGSDYLHRVLAATHRMAELIDDVLTLARVARHPIRHELVELSGLAEAIAQDLDHTEPERRVTWQIEEGLCASGDPHLLRVVLENLLGNAWKFTSRRDEATIEFGRGSDGSAEGYFVRDNGAGFDMAYADKLFAPFQRLHAITEFDGTGIGLATVQRIIHRHGGRAWAEGAPDQGATIYFSL